MVSTMEVQTDRMGAAALNSYALATDVADYLVAKGLTFRESHGIVARLSRDAVQSGKRLDELDLDTYRRFSDRFDENVLSITVESSIRARDVFGGTAPNRVEAAIEAARAELEAEVG